MTLALCALLTGAILKGLSLHKFVYVLFHEVCVRVGFADWLEKRFVYEKSFEELMTETDRPEVTVCG